MVTSLRPVAKDDQGSIQRWAGFAARHMSRTRPLDAAADRHAPDLGLYWYVVVADGRDVGAVWIELSAGAGEAVLGVFLGDESHLGRGIGTAAVELALAEFRAAHPGLPVALRVRRTNERAIACYRRAGFTVSGSGTKPLPLRRDRALLQHGPRALLSSLSPTFPGPPDERIKVTRRGPGRCTGGRRPGSASAVRWAGTDREDFA